MQTRWLFSQFYVDDSLHMPVPVCSAYGFRWFCPSFPRDTDGWALVQMLTTPQQIEASKDDPRVLVMPQLYDPTPLPQIVTDTYADWGATAGMTAGALIAKLEETEPVFGHTL
jgi:hypothetical protein